MSGRIVQKWLSRNIWMDRPFLPPSIQMHCISTVQLAFVASRKLGPTLQGHPRTNQRLLNFPQISCEKLCGQTGCNSCSLVAAGYYKYRRLLFQSRNRKLCSPKLSQQISSVIYSLLRFNQRWQTTSFLSKNMSDQTHK